MSTPASIWFASTCIIHFHFHLANSSFCFQGWACFCVSCGLLILCTMIFLSNENVRSVVIFLQPDKQKLSFFSTFQLTLEAALVHSWLQSHRSFQTGSGIPHLLQVTLKVHNYKFRGLSFCVEQVSLSVCISYRYAPASQNFSVNCSMSDKWLIVSAPE